MKDGKLSVGAQGWIKEAGSTIKKKGKNEIAEMNLFQSKQKKNEIEEGND